MRVPEESFWDPFQAAKSSTKAAQTENQNSFAFKGLKSDGTWTGAVVQLGIAHW